MNMRKRIDELTQKVLNEGDLLIAEAQELAATPEREMPYLLAAANAIRQQYQGDEVHLCSILNGRSGHCSEDCAYCAQSVHHQTGVAVYPLMDTEEMVRYAKAVEAAGVSHFSVVLSGRGMDDAEEAENFERIIETYRRIKEETHLKLCASLGSLTAEQARRLGAVGVERYHHNVETSKEYYASICRTHTYEDRTRTISVAQEAGLAVCSGGIIGMGETLAQRIDMAFELRAMGIGCVPVNVLNPVPGTRMESAPPLPPLDILKTLALFRFILPRAVIRTAGGREKNLRDLQSMALFGGANGMLVGGYLTTAGRGTELDHQMIDDLGLKVAL
ncbi:MAG: bioB [Firmicutes bacterium]|nr:bioB [Bacillota bacterium]